MTTGEVLRAMRAGRSGLRRPDLELPFEALCGELPRALPADDVDAGHDARQTRLALHLARQLEPIIEAAVARWGGDRVGMVIGTSTGGLLDTERALSVQASSGSLPDGYSLERTHTMGAAAEFVAGRFGITGPRYVVSTACSSGAKALAAGRRLIRCGMLDAVVSGGLDTLCHLTLRGFHGLGILSLTGCRPFARDRDGIAIGEGGALLVLERDGDGPAVLLGVGESSDAHHMSAPQPEGLGAEAAMAAALADAGIEPGDVALVNAHGTGTVANDASEAAAINRLLGDEVPVISTKGYMGHLLGAAGAVEAALCVAALEHGWAPGSLGCNPVDPTLSVHVQARETALSGAFVLSNSLAFGGSNASILWGATA